MTTKRTTPRQARVNLRLNSELVDWVKTYASANDTTLTDLVRAHLEELRKTKEAPRVIDQY